MYHKTVICNNQPHCSITGDIITHVILQNNFCYLFQATIKITLNFCIKNVILPFWAGKPMVTDVPRQVSLRRFPGSNVLSCYVIVILCYHIYI